MRCDLMCAVFALAIIGVSCGTKSSDKKIRTGTLPETLVNEEAFYTIRGSSDYSRAPLCFPLQLAQVAGTIDLHWKRDIVIENVLLIGLSNGYAYGESGPYVAFGKQYSGSWFLISVSGGELKICKDKAEYDLSLNKLNISSNGILSTKTVVDAFMKQGVLKFAKSAGVVSVNPGN